MDYGRRLGWEVGIGYIVFWVYRDVGMRDVWGSVDGLGIWVSWALLSRRDVKGIMTMG